MKILVSLTTALVLAVFGFLGNMCGPSLTVGPQPRSNAQTTVTDIVFKNGNIYTVDDRQPRAEAIAVTGNRIVFVGSNRDAQQYVGERTRVIDLQGKTVV